MAVAASGNGGLMVRIDPAESDILTGTTSAEVPTDSELAEWVGRGTAYARSLPAKR